MSIFKTNLTLIKKMKKSYYQPEDLKKFGSIAEWSEDLGAKFFDYYDSVFA